MSCDSDSADTQQEDVEEEGIEVNVQEQVERSLRNSGSPEASWKGKWAVTVSVPIIGGEIRKKRSGTTFGDQ